MVKFDTFSELVNRDIIQEDAHLAHKAEKKRKEKKRKEKHRQRDLLAATHRGSVSCTLGHSEPPSSTSLCTGHHNSSGDIGHLSNRSHRG